MKKKDPGECLRLLHKSVEQTRPFLLSLKEAKLKSNSATAALTSNKMAVKLLTLSFKCVSLWSLLQSTCCLCSTRINKSLNGWVEVYVGSCQTVFQEPKQLICDKCSHVNRSWKASSTSPAQVLRHPFVAVKTSSFLQKVEKNINIKSTLCSGLGGQDQTKV